MASATFASYIETVDDQSATLILLLQLDDIASIFTSTKGKGRANDAPNDQDYAFQLCRQDLEESVAILNDRKMGRSIARAVNADRHILAREVEAEKTAAIDRRLASEMEERTVTNMPQKKPSSASCASFHDDSIMDDEYLAKLMALYVSECEGTQLLAEDDNDGLPKGESSARRAKNSRNQALIDRRCEACREDKKFSDVARLPCRHEYCRDCLDQLFCASITDESLFPPRCCRQPISFASARIFLTSETAKKFENKRPELETPNRTYCSQSTCSAWIYPRNITEEVATCPQCYTPTCIICKAAAHPGDCPDDEATQMLLQTADESGWQRCYQCRRIVELDYGCNHMTCRCGAEFCYVCGARWKDCACPQWEENRLYTRAEQLQRRFQRMPLLRALDPVQAPVAAPAPAAPLADDDTQFPAPGPAEEAAITVPARVEETTAAAAETGRPATGCWPAGFEDDEVELGSAAARRLELEELVQHLRVNHECAHTRWNFVRGRHQCEECYHVLPQYIFECRQCMIQACNRCRRNRL